MTSKVRDRGAPRLLAMDLFAGCGGLTTGLKQAGFRVVAAVECDDLAAKTYRRNHRATKVWLNDIRDVNPAAVRKGAKLRRGQLDLLAACPPCQGFSTLRTLQGTRKVADERNDLIFEITRFVRELRPKIIMIENVPALAADARLARFCSALKKMKYVVEIKLMDASEYLVPQRRKRMVFFASRIGPVSFPGAARRRVTVRDAIGMLPEPRKSSDPLHQMKRRHSDKVLEIIKRVPKNGGSRRNLAARHQLACHRTCDGFGDVYGRMAWDEVSPTITSGCINPSKGRFIHPSQNRSISLREAALLQTFPPTYFFSTDRGYHAVALMIGNALPPRFVRQHAIAIRRALLPSGAHRVRTQRLRKRR